MKITNKTNDSLQHQRPDDCISPVLSDPPAKKPTKPKKNRGGTANEDQNQTPKTANPDRPIDDSEANTEPNGPHRGQFKPGQSGNPNGRPKGSFNKATLAARALLGRNFNLITQAAINLAASGSPLGIKLCLERMISIPRDTPVNLALPPDSQDGKDSPKEIYATQNAVLRAVAEGKITPSEGRHLSAIVETRRRTWESTELAERMTRLEANMAKRNKR